MQQYFRTIEEITFRENFVTNNDFGKWIVECFSSI